MPTKTSSGSKQGYYEKITNAVPALIVVYNIQTGQYLFVNESVKNILGYSPSEFTTGGYKFAVSLVHPHDLSEIMGKNQSALDRANHPSGKKFMDQTFLEFEYRMRHKNGTWIWLHSDARILSRDAKGLVENVMNISLDITSRKESENRVIELNKNLENSVRDRTRQLQSNERRYSTLLHAINEAVWSTDAKGNAFQGMDWWLRLTGQTQAEFRSNNGLGWINAIHPEDRERIKKKWKSSYKNKEYYHVTYRLKDKKGYYRYIESKGIPVKEDSRVVEWIGTLNDVTVQHQIEAERRQILVREQQALEFSRKEQQRLYQLLMAAPVPIAIIRSPSLVYEFSNSANNKFFGKKVQTGKKILDLFPEANSTGYVDILKNVHNTGKAFYGREMSVYVHRQGKLVERFVNFTYQPLKNAKNQVYSIMAIRVDVTDQVLARKKAESIQQELRFAATITASIADAVVGTDMQYKVLIWNSSAEQLYGWKASDVLGRPAGEVLPTEIIGTDTDWQKSIQTTGQWKGETIQTHKNGTKINVLSSVSLIKDASGQPIGLVAVNTDITQRKIIEKQKDDFMSMASHELKTPLTSIKVFNQLLLDKLKSQPESELIRYASRMGEQIDKLNRLVSDLLDVSRAQLGKLDLKKTRFSLSDLIYETVENLQPIAKNHQLIIKNFSREKVTGDRERLGQVLINLITNAVKYSPHAHKVEINVKSVNNNFEVSVKDYGIGIPTAHQDKIFGRFYRVNETNNGAYSGLGMGLYISKEIISRHGGRMWVQSRLHKGSTFYFTLPAKNSAST